MRGPLWFFLFSASAAATEQVTLQNGDILHMDCKAISDTQQQCTHPVLGHLTIDNQQILSVESDVSLPTKDTSNAPASAPWQIQLDVSANLRRGQQTSNTMSLQSDVKYTHERWRYSLASRFDLEDKESSRKTHKYQLTPAIDFFITPRWFLRQEIQYQYDFIANDYQNWDLSSGIGWRWWRVDDENYAETLLSVGLKQAWFRHKDPLYQGLFGSDPVLSYQFVALDWDIKKQLWPNIALFSKGRWLQLTKQPISIIDFDYEASNELGLRYQLSDAIRLSWSWYFERAQLRIELPTIPTYSLGLNDSRQQLAIGVEY